MAQRLCSLTLLFERWNLAIELFTNAPAKGQDHLNSELRPSVPPSLAFKNHLFLESLEAVLSGAKNQSLTALLDGGFLNDNHARKGSAPRHTTTTGRS